MKKTLIILLILLLSISGCKKDAAVNTDNSIQTISLETLEAIKESNKGKVLFINVFASWCPPCQEETPDFVHIYGKYNGGKDFELIGLSVDKNKKDLEKFINDYAINYPVYHISATVQRKLMADKVPTTLVFTPDGEYHTTILGAIDRFSFMAVVDRLKVK